MSPQPPSAGRVVHYTLSEKDSPKHANKVRPAIVIDVDDAEACSLHVLTKGGHDDLAFIHWRAGVRFDADGKPGTWRWPPFVAPKADKHPVAAPPPGFGNVPEQATLDSLVKAEKKFVEKPITDRFHTIADLNPTKPELTAAPDGLPFAYGEGEDDAPDSGEEAPESSR